MQIDQILRKLEWWKKRHESLEAQYQSFRSLTDATPECPLFDMVFKLWDAYTVAISEIIGDKYEWLQYYELECDMGKKPKEVTLPNGKKIRVKTLRQLARVITS